ncbi:MAG: hypothetical protein HY791_30350 [Deltaproteobacteria bacterium]|nr:hypothetical protein [Deltaproteobacteria bacterium]
MPCLAALGHPDGGDDTAALAVAAALADELPCVWIFDGFELLTLTTYDRVFVVDAARGLARGLVSSFDFELDVPSPIVDPRAVSTHGFGVDRAIRLARSIGVGTRFTIVAIGTDGDGSLTDGIARAVAAIRSALLGRSAQSAHQHEPR